MKYHAFLTVNPGLNNPPNNLCNLLEFSLLKLASIAGYTVPMLKELGY